MVDPIDAYARDVLRGRVPAGRYHRLACARHQRDRARAGTRAFPYAFDPAAVGRLVRFAAQLNHYKGEWAGQPIHLEPHQVFRLGSLVAWQHVATGRRRFRTAYNELPRKNGKSLEAAIIALYLTFFDGEPGAEGYVIATKREQARIVFNDCKALVRGSALKTRLAGASEKHGSLHRAATNSKLEALGADKDSTDGLNAHLVIADELHAYKHRGLLDVMETATGARRSPLHFQITTAGQDPVSPCGDQHDYACKILDEVLVDETFFAFIAHADLEDKARGLPADDWLDPRTWRKANPNYGISVKPDDLAALATKAANMPAAAAAFKQKRLNLWVEAGTPWLSLDGWRRGQSRWDPASLAGEPCYIGIDLSSKIDLTAIALVFPPTTTRVTWRLIVWCLTPQDTLTARAQRDRAPYPDWVAAPGRILTTNPGNRIDQAVVRAWVAEAASRYVVAGIGVDPWNAGNLVAELLDDGFQVVEVPQTIAQMTAPAKDFEADVLDGLVDAGGNPLMMWCVSNTVVQRDGKDNIYPTKRRSRGRIDPVIATLIGRKLAAIGDTIAEDPVVVSA